MNFVQTLEESLRDLAAEARKRHPGVKEASERATLRLRMLQNQYVSQVRRANAGDSEHPTTRLFGNSEILHPFLLAANYPNASAELLEIAFRAMRLLMEADAIQPSDAIQMLRVWMIQAQAVAAYYQKQYAKEIMQQEQAETLQQAESQSIAPATTTSSSSSAWFSWGSSSSTSVDATSKHGVAQSTKSSTTTSQQSPAQMEHRAKQILSCLLQLLETLKLHPDHLTMELWTNATAHSCLWLYYTPLKHTVHQAAQSTLRQVMNVLFASTNKSNDNLLVATWDDLLQLADHSASKSSTSLSGAFSLCKRNVAQMVTVHPPSPELALELLTRILREQLVVVDRCMTDKLLQKTMGISVQLLLQDKRASLHKSLRVVQWTGALFQQYRKPYPTECRELLALLLKPIQIATEACRSHDDFEDGYVFQDASDCVKDETTKGRLVTLIPPVTLWKAAFALEAIHTILEHDDTTELLVLLEDAHIVVGLSETLSDFATIGASCTDHILQLVLFGKSLPFTGTEVFAKNSVKVKPTFFRKAEQACTCGNEQSLLVDGAASKSSDKASPSGSLPSTGILGEALWISLQNLLRISECMNGKASVDQMLEHIFAPSLAVLQHYLKRCIGSSDLVQLVLKGYANLADVCLPMSVSHRKALLLSLCKLSLPTWGKRDPTGQLQNHHIMTLLYLCRIIHAHFESISDDWEIVLRTMDELSVISMASKQLSDEFYHAALALSILFSRLAPFTTCFSSASLLKLTQALTEITKSRLECLDVVGNNDTVVAQRVAPVDSLARQASAEGGESSISSKIINIGTRAIYGSGTDDKQTDVSVKDRPAVVFYEDYRREFVKRLSSSKSSIRVASIGNIPYTLAVLTDIIMANSFRFEQCGDQLSELLSSLASASPAVRPFTMDVLSVLAMSHLSRDRALPAPFIGPGRLIFVDPMQSQLWAVETCSDDSKLDETTTKSQEYDAKSQAELLAPLCQKIRTADKPDMAESSLGALSAILEGVGHNMTGDVWCRVIDAVSSLSGDPTYELVDRTPTAWSNCSSIAFRCLKFIVDDFRDQFSNSVAASKTLTSLLDCCSSFGRSKHDVNISLTAITLLWTIADQDPGSDSIDRALSRLVDLASDTRAEVRNAAVNTLFSCIVGRGATFTALRWESCFSETIFGVYDLVAVNASIGDAAGRVDNQQIGKRYRVSLHHSRDSDQKQWLETQTLVLRGLTRLLRNYFSQILDRSEPDDATKVALEASNNATWIREAWLKILDYTFEAATHDGGRDTVAIRTAGVELMVLCCQLASDAGIEAATAPARVGTSMEVVNGALRSVRDFQPVKATAEKKYSAGATVVRKQLYLEAFEAIDAYNDAVAQAIKQGSAADETLVQVIHSFMTGLSHLYDCSKGSELRPREVKILSSLEQLDTAADSNGDVEDLESRFIRIITSMLVAASGNSTSRFLNQGQRVSLNLLRTMASQGSALAFKELIDLAEPAFFSKRQTSVNSNSVLAYEASIALSEEVVQDSVADECKAYVLHQVLNTFLRHHDEDDNEATKNELSYENLIPVVTTALFGLTRLPSHDPFTVRAAELVWGNLTNCLSRLLSPTTSEDGGLRIGNVSELLQIIVAAKENIADTFVSELSTVLSFGASKALLVARKLDEEVRTQGTSDEDTGIRKEELEQVINLFETCYAFCCELQPDDQVLKSITKSVLSEAALESQEFSEEIALIVCRSLRNDKLESLVISVFAQLSRLATAPSVTIRDAVSEVFNVVDVAAILDSARKKCEASEERAKLAEERVQELSKKVKTLQDRNVELTQEVAVLQASSAM